MSTNRLRKGGGGGRIRTHGEGQPHNGFQDRRLKPLGHSSVITLIEDYELIDIARTSVKKINSFYVKSGAFFLPNRIEAPSESKHYRLSFDDFQGLRPPFDLLPSLNHSP